MSQTLTESSELLHVDPASLKIGANVRVDTHPDAKEFARSVRERGVVEVITVYRDDSDDLVVYRGQRRTLVAAQVGTPSGTVPVRVVPKPDEADRIVDQLVENLHRADMHDAEVLSGVEQLSLIGVSAAQIAKRVTIKRSDVDAALVVAQSEGARAQMASEQLTLEEAAVFAEFDGDEAATARLLSEIRRGQSIAHVAQRLRDEAAERAEYMVEVERLRAEGLPVLDPDDVPSPLWNLRMDELRDAEGNPVDEDAWPTIEGAAVALRLEWIYPDEPDDDGEDSEDSESDDTDGDVEEAEPVRGFVPMWIVVDPAAAGLHHYSQGRSGAVGVESEADREAARAERALALRNNKAWRSAETVRQEWLRGFITRKSVPSGAESLICEAVVGCDYRLGKAIDNRHKTLRALLGESSEEYYGQSVETCNRLASEATTPKTATTRTLAAVLCAWEDSLSVQTWRSPTAWDARIMNALIGWGYEPSDVERILIGEEPSIAEAPDEHAA